MDRQFLDAYSQQLAYMLELAGEWSKEHPKIAKRLGMQVEGEIGDPYVERLMQAFSFTAARTQVEIDRDFPQFTQPLLETVYPNYNAPTPSAAVARLHPGAFESNAQGGFRIARGAAFRSTVSEGEASPCVFVSSQDVALYPLEIISAQLTGVPPDIPSLERLLSGLDSVKGALRLKLRTSGGAISDLRDLERLPVYLSGDERIASRLFELLHVASVASVIGVPGRFGERDASFHLVADEPVVHEALEPNEGLLPLNQVKFNGHNLLHEFVGFASRFWFFTLTGLSRGLRRIDGREVEIIVLLSQSPDALMNQVDASHFALFCTPVINLFPLEIDSLELSTDRSRFQADNEVLVSPVESHPLDYEVFRIERLYGHVEAESEKLEFAPRYHALNRDEGGQRRFYTVRREPRNQHDKTRRYRTRTPYTASDLYAALEDRDGRAYPDRMNYLSAKIWATNGDLPNLLQCNGRDDLMPIPSTPIESVGLVRAPSTPKPPYAQGALGWDLIRQLNFGLPLLDAGAEGLRRLLRLFVSDGDADLRQQIESITSLTIAGVTRKLPGRGPIPFGRGHGIRLEVNEAGFGGTSPYLFGLILDRYLARHVSMHSFIQLDLHTLQRGLIASFPVRMGTRGVA